MAKENKIIRINEDCFASPSYFLLEDSDKFGIEVEVTEAESDWVKKIMEEFDKVQDFLEKKYKIAQRK
jgi:hypothetical protein